jgi:hypothetical protein
LTPLRAAILATAAPWQGQHMHGWGAPEIQTAAGGPVNWSGIDRVFGPPNLPQLGFMRGAQRRFLYAAGCPAYMKVPKAGSTLTQGYPIGDPTKPFDYTPPHRSWYDDSAELVARIVARNPQITDVAGWNELKGYFGNGRWAIEDYTEWFNKVAAKVHAVNPAVRMWGPYCIFITLGWTDKTNWDPNLYGKWGHADKRITTALDYFIRNQSGAYGLCLDVRNSNRDTFQGYNDAPKFDMAVWQANPNKGVDPYVLARRPVLVVVEARRPDGMDPATLEHAGDDDGAVRQRHPERAQHQLPRRLRVRCRRAHRHRRRRAAQVDHGRVRRRHVLALPGRRQRARQPARAVRHGRQGDLDGADLRGSCRPLPTRYAALRRDRTRRRARDRQRHRRDADQRDGRADRRPLRRGGHHPRRVRRAIRGAMTPYRYTLTRRCGGLFTDRRLCWVMLNPSTADETADDPTIRRVLRFTSDADYGELEVVNLFAARATNPNDLLTIADPIGPDNDSIIAAAFNRANDVVFAWGASPAAHKIGLERRGLEVWTTCRSMMRLPLCLGTTKDGAPRHPLYVRADQQLVVWQQALATQPA